MLCRKTKTKGITAVIFLLERVDPTVPCDHGRKSTSSERATQFPNWTASEDHQRGKKLQKIWRNKRRQYLIKKNWNTIVWAQCGCFYESSDVISISEITLTALYDVHTGTIIDRHRLSRKDCQILDPKKLCCFPYSSWLEKTKEQVWIKSYSSASYFVNCWKGIGPSEAQSVTTKFTLS